MNTLTHIKNNIPTKKSRQRKSFTRLAVTALATNVLLWFVLAMIFYHMPKYSNNKTEVTDYFEEFMKLTSYEEREKYLAEVCDHVQDVKESELYDSLLYFVVDAKLSLFGK